jgi:hypothetical protein
MGGQVAPKRDRNQLIVQLSRTDAELNIACLCNEDFPATVWRKSFLVRQAILPPAS